MQYMLMFYQPAAEFEQRNDASSQAYRASRAFRSAATACCRP